jgi:WD40 repeat protein
MTETRENPYVGPRTFKTDEGELFFGREREALDLLSLVISERLVLFYAQSGAGKSSLINTRLVPGLMEEGEFEVLPIGRVKGEFKAVNADNIYVFNLLCKLTQHRADQSLLSRQTLTEFLAGLDRNEDGYYYNENPARRLFEKGKAGDKRVLIIDQFEELFITYHEEWQRREDFFRQLAEAMEAFPNLWVALAMREDYIAYLDPYAYLLPGRLRVRYYMQRLGHDAAVEAVEGPAGKRSRRYADGVAEQLVNDLSSIKVRKPDDTLETRTSQFVEPVQLQVVCSTLWKRLPSGKDVITAEDLEKHVGDVNRSLGDYYAERVETVARENNFREQVIRDWFEKKLITAGGIRNMVLREPRGKSGGLDDNIVQALHELVRAEQRGGATFYELTHDRLVEPIIENNRKWNEEHSSPFRKEAEAWKESGEQQIYLRSEQALVEANEWALKNDDKLSDVDREFLEASRKNQARIEEKRAATRRFITVAMTLVVIAIATSIYALIQKRIADQRLVEAQNSEATAIASQKEALSAKLSVIALDHADSRLDLAILLGLHAYKIDDNDQTENGLLALLQKSDRFSGILDTEEEIEEIQYSPDGKYFASRSKSGILLWNADDLSLRYAGDSSLPPTPINGHFSPVYSIAFSPDGKMLASGGTDGYVILWDAETREVIGEPFKGQTGFVWSVAFTPDGKTLASASDDRTVILWDVATRTQIGQPLAGHKGAVISVAFSPDGKTLASGSEDDAIILWNVQTRTQIGDPLTGHKDRVWSVVFSPDGRSLASGSTDGIIILWDVASRQPSQPLTGHTGPVRGMAFSPDGKTLASASYDYSIILWDVAARQMIGQPLKEHTDVVFSVAFTPDGKTLASGSYDNTVILWNVEKQTRIGSPLTSHTRGVISLAFDSDGQTLATGSLDTTIRFWDVSTLASPRTSGLPLQGQPGRPTAMYFSPDGSVLASIGDDNTILFDVETLAQIGAGEIKGNTPDGRIMVFQSYDKDNGEYQLHFWDIAAKKELTDRVPGEYLDISASPIRPLLVYATLDKETDQAFINLWDIKAAESVEEGIIGTYKDVTSDGGTLIYQYDDMGTGESSIILWDIRAGKPAQTISGGDFQISEDKAVLAFPVIDPDSEITYINLLDTATGETVANLAEIGPFSFWRLSDDGSTLVYQPSDETGGAFVHVVDIQSRTTIGKHHIFYTFYNFMAMSKNGRVLVLQSYNDEGKSVIYALDTQTGKFIGEAVSGSFTRALEDGQVMVFEFIGDDGAARFGVINTSIATLVPGVFQGSYLNLYQDGKVLIYYSSDGGVNRIYLFDTANYRLIGEPFEGTFVAASPDGKTLITRGQGNVITAWDTTRTWPFGEPVGNEPNSVTAAALSPDGGQLAFSNADGITLVNVSDGSIARSPFNDHSGKVVSVMLSEDGKTLLSFGEDGKTIAWDLSTYERIGDPIPGTNAILSPNGKYAAVVKDYATVTLWDLNSGAASEPIPGQAVFFSPDSRVAAISDAVSGFTILWDTSSKAPLGEPVAGTNIAFVLNGKFLAIGNSRTNTTELWDVNEGKFLDETLPGSYILPAAQDGNIAVVVDSNAGTSLLWNLETNERIGAPIPGSYAYFAGTDPKILVVQNYSDFTTTLWNVSTGGQIGGAIAGTSSPSFSPNGKLMSTLDSASYSTIIWNLTTGEKVYGPFTGYVSIFCPDDRRAVIRDFAYELLDLESQTVLGKPITGENAAISPDCNKAAVIDGGIVTLWSLEDGGQISDPEHSIQGDSVVFSPNGKIMAVTSYDDNETTLWDIEKFTPIAGPVTGSIYLNGNVISIYDNYRASLWNLDTGARIGEEITTGYYYPLFTSDGRLVVYDDKGVTLWDVDKNEMLGSPLRGHTSLPTSLLYSPDGRLLASLAADGFVLTNLETGSSDHLVARDYTGQFTGVMVFSADGAQFTALGTDGTVVRWDVDTGVPSVYEGPLKDLAVARSALSPNGEYLAFEYYNELSVLNIEDPDQPILVGDHKIKINTSGGAIAFSPDGVWIAYNDGSKIVLRNVAEDTQSAEFFTGSSGINSLDIIMGSDAPRYLISVDQSGMTQIWDASTGSKIGDGITEDIRLAGLSAEGRIAVYIDGSGRLIKLSLDPSMWIEPLCSKARRELDDAEWNQYIGVSLPRETVCSAAGTGQEITPTSTP